MSYYSMLSSGPFPREYATKTLNVSWRTSSYTKEELVDSYSPLSYYAVSVDPLTETNGTFGVTAGLAKHSSAAFTLATAERRDETIAKFYPYYSAYDWVRIKNLRRSELDLLLSCSGSDSMADSTNPSSRFLPPAGGRRKHTSPRIPLRILPQGDSLSRRQGRSYPSCPGL